MKELYISPEMEILCFAPVEKLASNFGYDTDNSVTPFSLGGGSSDGVSTGETRDDDVIVTTPTTGESFD